MFDINYHVFKDFNIPFDEKGSTCGTIREVQWYKDESELDESKAKIEIRKIYQSSDGEKTGKGYTFSTPEGPHDLAEGLVGGGFGNTKNLLRSIRNRDDFLEAAQNINDDNEGSDSGDMFDMRDLLLGIDNSEDDEDD